MKKTAVCFILVTAFFFAGENMAYPGEKKDHMKAFLMSFIVPGLGQFYAGSSGYAKIFIASELAIWSGYYYNTKMMEASRQDYFSYAVLHAGVNPSGYGANYINAVGAYNSSFDHNQYRKQSSVNPVLYADNKTWNWDAAQNRIYFRELRERELDYKNNTKYCIAGIMLNHFISALHASKMVQQLNRTDSALTFHVLDSGLSATITRAF